MFKHAPVGDISGSNPPTIVLMGVGLTGYLLGAQAFAHSWFLLLFRCFMSSCGIVKRKRGSHTERNNGVRREEMEGNPGI